MRRKFVFLLRLILVLIAWPLASFSAFLFFSKMHSTPVASRFTQISAALPFEASSFLATYLLFGLLFSRVSAFVVADADDESNVFQRALWPIAAVFLWPFSAIAELTIPVFAIVTSEHPVVRFLKGVYRSTFVGSAIALATGILAIRHLNKLVML